MRLIIDNSAPHDPLARLVDNSGGTVADVDIDPEGRMASLVGQYEPSDLPEIDGIVLWSEPNSPSSEVYCTECEQYIGAWSEANDHAVEIHETPPPVAVEQAVLVETTGPSGVDA